MGNWKVGFFSGQDKINRIFYFNLDVAELGATKGEDIS